MKPTIRAGRAPVGKKTVAGVVGVACAAVLTTTVTLWEGKRNVGYRDIAGIPTACYGDTKNVAVGQYYSDAECSARLESQLIAHAEPVLACTPEIAGTTYQLAAATSLAYNIGTGAYCKSTTARRFRAGDWASACQAMNLWVYSGGKRVQGLANRRAAESALCARDIPEAHRS